ncbi:MAG: glycosyltransferase [Caulobacteraceae bacterium]
MSPRFTAIDGRAGPPVRVMLLLGSLSGGGAERVAVNLIDRCDPSAVDLTMALLRRTGPYLAKVEPSRVIAPKSLRTGLLGAARAPADIARMVRRRRPQVLMSFGMGVNMLAWLALQILGEDRPLWVCREDSNTDAEIADLTGSRLGRAAVGVAVRRMYRSADRLLAVSQDLASMIERRLAIPAGHTHVIYNPIDVAEIVRSAAMPLAEIPSRPFIVAAGRLTRQKGHDLLIEAFAASPAAREIDLVILGEGPLEGALRSRAVALGVGERVRFPGFQANPWAWFSRARLFVLPSRWEGFGNVVAEALACGVPVLVADCDFGPREQVVHGVSGWVVTANDAAALTGGLDTLLGDPALAARLAVGGRSRAGDFDAGATARAYADFFLELAYASAARTAAWPSVAAGRPRPRSQAVVAGRPVA